MLCDDFLMWQTTEMSIMYTVEDMPICDVIICSFDYEYLNLLDEAAFTLQPPGLNENQ